MSGYGQVDIRWKKRHFCFRLKMIFKERYEFAENKIKGEKIEPVCASIIGRVSMRARYRSREYARATVAYCQRAYLI